jgi:predicted ATPase/DNA-binding CsgD family transcriptional regulator
MQSNVSERAAHPHGGSGPGPLPAHTTSFVGRSDELAALETEFESARIVTITGPGGSGKTRLALEFVARHRTPRPTAVVDLAPVGDTALVTGTVASALGVRPEAGDDPLDAIVRGLGEDEVVVVLDNLEHLAGVGSIVADLLARAPGVRILGTSRAPLRIRGEHEFPLAPLRLPDDTQVNSVAGVAEVESVLLFVERARAIRPEFELTDDNAGAVARICTRLDGLPLAIELAAARVRLFSPGALLQRLDHTLPVLTGGPIDAPARQRTLRATIEWSYELLDDEDRGVFGSVAVFAGPFTLDAADAVAVPDSSGGPERPAGARDVLTNLERLVDQSVVVASEGTDGEPRFRLLETIREFAWAQVPDDAQRTIRDLHLDWFTTRAEDAEHLLRGPEQSLWLRRLAAEQADIRAALAWAEQAHRAESLVRLASSLRRRFWYEAGGLREGRRWLEAAIAVGSEVPAGLRARALQRAAWIVWELDDVERANELFEASLEASDDGDHLTRFEALIGLTYRAMGAGGPQLEVAASRMDEAIDAARRAGTAGALVEPLTAQGKLAEARGDRERAATYFEEAAEMAREAGDAWGTASGLLPLGLIRLSEGDAAGARLLLEESSTLALESGDREVLSHAVAALARSLVEMGELEAARSRLREGAEIARHILNPLGDMFLLEAVAAWLAWLPFWQAAIEAWASADAYRAERPWSEHPQDVVVRRRKQDAARAALGPVRYERAWAAGAVRDVRSAVDAAMAVVETVDLDVRPSAAETPPRRGRFDLTPREQEVLALVAAGMTDGEIADSLVISKKTASVHVAHIKSKLGASSRVEIATIALREHLD